MSKGKTIVDRRRPLPFKLNVKDDAIEPISDIVKLPIIKLIKSVMETERLPVNKKFIRKAIITNGNIENNQCDNTLASIQISSISELITIPSSVPSS